MGLKKGDLVVCVRAHAGGGLHSRPELKNGQSYVIKKVRIDLPEEEVEVEGLSMLTHMSKRFVKINI